MSENQTVERAQAAVDALQADVQRRLAEQNAAEEGSKQIEKLTRKVVELEQQNQSLKHTCAMFETTIRVQALLMNPNAQKV